MVSTRAIPVPHCSGGAAGCGEYRGGNVVYARERLPDKEYHTLYQNGALDTEWNAV